MMDVRPICAPEAEPFLRLLCTVFNLDLARARSIFYNEPFFDLNRKWAIVDRNEILSILTTVPLEFGWGNAIGIAGVATRPDQQGQGLAGRLIHEVLRSESAQGVKAAYLFARDTRLYADCGFELLDEAIYAPLKGRTEYVLPRTLSFDEASAVYAAWANADPNRLRRDERRWSYWKWNLRVCTAHHEGYLCLEGNVVRECVPGFAEESWPVPNHAEWFGLRSMARVLNAPIGPSKSEISFMGWRSPAMPQLFLTDQF